MRKTITTLIDDVDGSEASETVRFALDGTDYEIDLSEKNAAALRNALAPFTTRAHTTGRPARSRKSLPSSGASRNGEIRAWAAAQGKALPERGRIPTLVIQEFDASR